MKRTASSPPPPRSSKKSPLAKPRMDYSNLPPLEKHYEKLSNDCLGKGNYGTVYKAKNKQTNMLVAIKVFDTSEMYLEELASCEIATLRRLSHENIVTLVGTALDSSKKLCMITQLANYNLRMLIPTMNFLSANKVKGLMVQLLRGLEYCHDCRVMHRDLKPENIVVGNDKCLKLIDFGMSHTMVENYRQYTNQVTTLYYRDPQLTLGSRSYSSEVDMWSISE